jgi:hypothetical protein
MDIGTGMDVDVTGLDTGGTGIPTDGAATDTGAITVCIGMIGGGGGGAGMGALPYTGACLIGPSSNLSTFFSSLGPPVGRGIRCDFSAFEYFINSGYALLPASSAHDQMMYTQYASVKITISAQKNKNESVNPQTKALPIRCTSLPTIVLHKSPLKKNVIHQHRFRKNDVSAYQKYKRS